MLVDIFIHILPFGRKQGLNGNDLEAPSEVCAAAISRARSSHGASVESCDVQLVVANLDRQKCDGFREFIATANISL